MLQNTVPFKRGATFTFLLELPPAVEDGHFAGWSLKSRLRRQENNLTEGFIADLTATWEDPATARRVRIHHPDTSAWPVGIAEVDVRFTSPEGIVVASTTLYFDILPEVTP